MRSFTAIFCITTVLAFPPQLRSEPAPADVVRPSTSEAQASSTCIAVTKEQVIEQQDRINKYLHHDVVPKMASCWATLSGHGSVAISFDFRRNKDEWTLNDAKLRKSTLRDGEGDLAMHCLKEAMLGTSFPVTDIDVESVEKAVNWSFPVPWPKSKDEVMALAVDTGGGGGGCGGAESPGASCYDCVTAGGRPTTCELFCTGFKTCTVNPDRKGCNLGPISPRCVTGSVFGNLGGIVMY